jgi:hypothetical protein
MEVASIMKGAYDHFMQKEIHEQPESLAQTLMGRIKLTGKARRSFRSNSSGSVSSDSDCSDSGMSTTSDSPNNLLGTKVRRHPLAAVWPASHTFVLLYMPCQPRCALLW